MKLRRNKYRFGFLIVAAIVATIGVVCVSYAYFYEPYETVINQVKLKVPHWNSALNGFKIVAISDIHGGGHTITEERIRDLVAKANEQNPDIIVLLGDFVSQIYDDHPEHKRELAMPILTIAENLRGLHAKYGVYGVIGNHDWWYDEAECRQALEFVGFKVLENQTASFNVNGQTVTVLGIEDYLKRKTVDVTGVLAKLPSNENIIGLTHNPDSFPKTPEDLAILVAGHTHGGQVNFPFIGAPIVPASRKYTAGHVVENGKNLFVTTGIGTSGLPFRFRVPPEIAVIILDAE